MTTIPLKEPFRLRAEIYLGDRWLASIKCWLSPAGAPILGMALVTPEHDWLALGSLALLLRDGKQYQIMPTQLEPTAGEQSLLRFDVI